MSCPWQCNLVPVVGNVMSVQWGAMDSSAWLTYIARGVIEGEWQKAVSGRAGWHHQGWYNQVSRCKRAVQSRARGRAMPHEAKHTAALCCFSAQRGSGSGFWEVHCGVVSSAGKNNINLWLDLWARQWPLRYPVIFIGYTETQGASTTRGRAHCIYPGVCCSLPVATILKAD